jgi:hypothetical protein
MHSMTHVGCTSQQLRQQYLMAAVSCDLSNATLQRIVSSRAYMKIADLKNMSSLLKSSFSHGILVYLESFQAWRFLYRGVEHSVDTAWVNECFKQGYRPMALWFCSRHFQLMHWCGDRNARGDRNAPSVPLETFLHFATAVDKEDSAADEDGGSIHDLAPASLHDVLAYSLTFQDLGAMARVDQVFRQALLHPTVWKSPPGDSELRRCRPGVSPGSRYSALRVLRSAWFQLRGYCPGADKDETQLARLLFFASLPFVIQP